MPFLRQLVRQSLRDMDAERVSALERGYCRLLRRALQLGWVRAKIEYLPLERARGRPVPEIMADLALFEDLNLLALRHGLDPVEMQRRTDLYRTAFRPLTVVAAAILVAVMATSQIPAITAVIFGGLCCWLSLRTTRAILSLD